MYEIGENLRELIGIRMHDHFASLLLNLQVNRFLSGNRLQRFDESL
jgi:hypothetical protein